MQTAIKIPYQLKFKKQIIIEQPMGASSSKESNFDASQWQRVQSQHNDSNGYEISTVRNKLSGQLLDLYTLTFPNQQQFEKYIDSIGYRTNEKNIVRVVAYDPKVIKQFCGASYMLDVYLEHCRSRLNEYEDIPYPDYLYCGVAMLDGYNKLFNKVGGFNVTETQVMIDQNGEVRVWLNEDFCENQAKPLPPMKLFRNLYEENEMVSRIMRMVLQNSDQAEGPNMAFSDFYQKQSSNMNRQVGFEQAKNIIQQYAQINNVKIPQIFTSVFEIYQNDSSKDNHEFLLANQLADTHLDHDANRSFDNVGQVSYRPVESLLNNQVSSIQPKQPLPYHVAAPGFTRVPSNQNLAQVQVVNPGLQGVQIFPGSPVHAQRTQPNIQGHHFAPLQNYLHQPIHHQNQSSGLGTIRIPPPVQRPINNNSNRAFPIQIRPQPLGTPFAQHPHPQPSAFPHGQLPAYQLQPHFMNRAPTPSAGQIQMRGLNHRQYSHEAQMGADELEIEKKLILKDSGNVEEFVNEANIIKQLSEFHKAESDEKRRSFGRAEPQIHGDLEKSNEGQPQEIQNYYASKNEKRAQPSVSPRRDKEHGGSYVNFSQLPQLERNSRQLYYTLENEVELDPEIAADIASFMKT